MTRTADTAHEDLLHRICATTTAAELAAVFDTVTFLDKPGFADDLPDGDYCDGAYFATFCGGQRTFTLVRGKPAGIFDGIWHLWDELERTRRDERNAARAQADETEAARRGRPAVGDKVQTRFPAWQLAAIDQYASRRDISRAEAIRELAMAGLKTKEEN